jgi:hypothetical protein
LLGRDQPAQTWKGETVKPNRYAKQNATGKRAQERIAAYYRLMQGSARTFTIKPKPKQ